MDSSDECELLDSGIFDVNSMVNDDKNEAFLKTLDNDKLDLLVWIENLYENHSKDGIYLNRESHSQELNQPKNKDSSSNKKNERKKKWKINVLKRIMKKNLKHGQLTRKITRLLKKYHKRNKSQEKQIKMFWFDKKISRIIYQIFIQILLYFLFFYYFIN